jgi:predicted oxidoreductase
MKYIQLKDTDINASEIALGCMRIAGLSEKNADTLIGAALEEGINFLRPCRHLRSGSVRGGFARTVAKTPGLREKIVVQTKCGIRKGYYDFSREHIISSVDGSLKRLKTDYIDILLLHRPDTLMEPEEVAEAFTTLQQSGKVRYFGVSNQKPLQIELLMKYLKQESSSTSFS